MTETIKPKINNFPHVVSFRLDNAAFAILKAAADAHGRTPNDFARTLATRSADTQVKLPAVKVRAVAADALRNLYVEQVRQGNNVNQIARSLNQGDRSALLALTSWLTTSKTLMSAIADALGTDIDP